MRIAAPRGSGKGPTDGDVDAAAGVQLILLAEVGDHLAQGFGDVGLLVLGVAVLGT